MRDVLSDCIWNLFSGVGENGIEDIKAHTFFSSIDWEVCCKVFCLECTIFINLSSCILLDFQFGY